MKADREFVKLKGASNQGTVLIDPVEVVSLDEVNKEEITVMLRSGTFLSVMGAIGEVANLLGIRWNDNGGR